MTDKTFTPLAHTLILTSRETALFTNHAMQMLYAYAGIAHPDAYLLITNDASDGIERLDETLKSELAFSSAIGFGRCINTLGIDHDDVVPGEIRVSNLDPLRTYSTRVLYFPSLKSSWWADAEHVKFAATAVRTVSIAANPWSSLFSGSRVTDLDLADVPHLLEISSN